MALLLVINKKTYTMKKTIILLFIPVLFSSCATLLSGTHDTVYVKCNVEKADVYVDGNLVGKTNEDINLRRKYKGKRNVELKSAGHNDSQFTIDQKIAVAYWFGILGSGVPMLIDIATGAALKPKETRFDIQMFPSK